MGRKCMDCQETFSAHLSECPYCKDKREKITQQAIERRKHEAIENKQRMLTFLVPIKGRTIGGNLLVCAQSKEDAVLLANAKIIEEDFPRQTIHIDQLIEVNQQKSHCVVVFDGNY